MEQQSDIIIYQSDNGSTRIGTFSRTGSNSGILFEKADELWTSFQEGIADFVNQHQEQATVLDPVIKRPEWSLIKDVIDGRAPLSSLSSDCK